MNVHMGNFIHVFLTLLAVLVMVAASIALVQIVHHGFPQLWQVADEYATLHELLQKILLLAIAGELGLLLLFHRATRRSGSCDVCDRPAHGGNRRHRFRSADGLSRALRAAGSALLFFAGKAEVGRNGLAAFAWWVSASSRSCDGVTRRARLIFASVDRVIFSGAVVRRATKPTEMPNFLAKARCVNSPCASRSFRCTVLAMSIYFARTCFP